MIDFFEIYEEFTQAMDETQARLFLKALRQVYSDLNQAVTKDDFNALKTVVQDLAGAQRQTEERLGTLVSRMDELAAAQRRTEERVEELAAAQKRTEERLEVLTARVDELAAAQKRTEERLEALTARVDKLAARVDELAAAQKRTEERLEALTARVDELAAAQKRTNERLDGLSNSVGYTLENAAYKALPALLAARGVRVHGRLIRRYLGEFQLNIYGQGELEGRPVTIVGECKVRPSRKEVDRFLRVIRHLEQDGLIQNPYWVFVAHDYHPSVEAYLAEKGVAVFWSYEL